MRVLNPALGAADRDRVGINTGEAFVGNMGSDMRFDYSIVGDTVNVASRLEEATKEMGVPIVVARIDHAAGASLRLRPARRNRAARAQPSNADLCPAWHRGAGGRDVCRLSGVSYTALTAFAAEAPDAAAKIRAAREHPCGEAYATFYARLGQDIPAFLPRAV